MLTCPKSCPQSTTTPRAMFILKEQDVESIQRTLFRNTWLHPTMQTLGLSPSRSGEAFLMTERTSKPRGERTEPHLQLASVYFWTFI